MKIVVIGAVALGPKAGVRAKRLMPGAEITIIDRDSKISYGGCGIPYYISGDVSDSSQLQTTSFHMVRDVDFFARAKGVSVLDRTEAEYIDRKRKVVGVKSLADGSKRELPYDKLVIATGSKPNRLSCPGADLSPVYNVTSLGQAEEVKKLITRGKVEKAVVVGAGAIGLEVAEALADLWDIETTVVEIAGQVLPGVIGPHLAAMVACHLREKGVNLLLNERVECLEGDDGELERVRTDQREIETDLVIMAMGVRPSSELAAEAGLEIGTTGGIKVNARLETSDPDIYAGGDVIETVNLVTGLPAYAPYGSLANRQGRIIGTNLAGGDSSFDGVVGSTIIKIFDLAAAGVGLTPAAARAAGFDAVSALVVQGNKAHFHPGSQLLYLELTADRQTRRVLGVQGVSLNGEALATRIDAVAAILKYKPTIDDLANLELAYAPPFASAMDIVNAAGNVLDNIISGLNETIEAAEFIPVFETANGDGKTAFLDVRAPSNAEPFVAQFAPLWVNIPQEQLAERLDEVPDAENLYLVCNTGARSYEALVALKSAGRAVKSLQGGVMALRNMGLALPE